MANESQTRGWHPARMSACALGTFVLCVMLAACSGTTGSAGPAGPAGAAGPAGPQGSGAGPVLDITTASSITGTVTSVAISGPPVVKFSLADQNGAPLKGLPAADIGWVDRTAGARSKWYFQSMEFLHLRHRHARRLPRRCCRLRLRAANPGHHGERRDRQPGRQLATAPTSTRSRKTSRRIPMSSTARL